MQIDSINPAPKGARPYELKNHLGNVLATVSDRKDYNGTNFTADISSSQDYYPFGMQMPGRTFSSNNYRYGFNGMEKDDEIKGAGDSLDFGARIYDSRLGRWLSLDPMEKEYVSFSPYNFSLNNPILFVDEGGNYVKGKNGKPVKYSVVEGKISWSSNASVDVMRVGNAMLKTSQGRDIWADMENTSYPIEMKIDHGFSVGNPKRLGIANVTSTGGGIFPTGPINVKNVEIVLFEGRIKEAAEECLKGDVLMNKEAKYTAIVYGQTGSIEDILGGVGVHEGLHATDPVNIKLAKKNYDNDNNFAGIFSEFDDETEPNKVQTEHLKQIIDQIKVSKLKLKKVDKIEIADRPELKKR